MKDDREPLVQVRNGQRSINISCERLQSFGQTACRLAWKHKRPHSSIHSLDEISVHIVGDRTMAKLHKQFSGVSGPTDVLTFDHGEIFISAQTAARQAREFHSTIGRELRLYLLHGLLHLCGLDDRSAKERREMHQLQSKVMRVALTQDKQRGRALRRLNA